MQLLAARLLECLHTSSWFALALHVYRGWVLFKSIVKYVIATSFVHAFVCLQNIKVPDVVPQVSAVGVSWHDGRHEVRP